jgi:succinate dehydrogenase / fumarate reductase membrane anchor subunit
MSALAYADAIEFIAAPMNQVFLLLLCGSLAYHSYLGVEVVIDDYVHGPRVKLFSHNLSRIAHAVTSVVAIYSILQIGPGA